jgi:GNAT superfamily N-acetyltransferase
MPPYPIEPLGPEHDRAAFACGVPLLDSFLHERVGQFAQRHLAQPFVMVDPARSGEKQTIAGYYTLSSQGLDYDEMPGDLRRKLPKRIRVGVTLIGYLAVDRRYQGQGLGKLLLYDALYHALQASKQVSSRAVIVDAVDDAARAFYERYDFTRFTDASNRLYVPMDTIAAMFSTSELPSPC